MLAKTEVENAFPFCSHSLESVVYFCPILGLVDIKVMKIECMHFLVPFISVGTVHIPGEECG